MAKKDAKERIVEAFIEAVRTSSLSGVRIADLISSLGINRNTFYYHFSSKYDVAMWVLRRDLARALQDELPSRLLIDAPVKEGSSETLPYYMRHEIAARTLDGAPFFRAFCKCMLSNAPFYRKLFDVREAEFIEQVERLWEPAFYDDVNFILDKRYMPEETKRFLASMSVHHMIARIEYALQHPADENILLDDEANPFWNLLHESLHFAIQKHPINRRTPHPNAF